MTCGIYKITNKINGKCYIGQSKNIERRWKEHKRGLDKGDTVLYRAMRKYGLENFKFEILEVCSDGLLDNLEIRYIDEHNSYVHCDEPNGYNETLGGSGIIGYFHTEKDRFKASKNRALAIKYKDELVKFKELKESVQKSHYSSRLKLEKDLDCKEIVIIDRHMCCLLKSIELDEMANIDVDDTVYEAIEVMEGNDTMDDLCDYWMDMGLYSSYEEFYG